MNKNKIKPVGFCIILLFLVWVSQIANAQWNMFPRPHDEWQILETQHFHVHFTPELEPWTNFAVQRMEAIHESVTKYIGYNEIDGPMPVFILDPMGMPNGMAVPFLETPRIVLWPNSPVNPLMLGGLESWPEIVMTHEYAHAVHLTRKSRSWQGKMITALLPVGLIATKAPMWVTEGYAVIIESDLTGYGRGQSSLRSMVISQLALEGKLPEYSELNGADKWMGGRYPYLIGSAFLEWLRGNHKDRDCLLHLWKRLTAKENRDFNSAFSGVFQDDPEDLYDRFRAELTREALVLEEDFSGLDSHDAQEWQYLEGLTGKPDVSRDGKSIAVVTRPWKAPSKLVVWSLDEIAEKKPDPALDDLDDVPELSIHPPERKELYSFLSKNGINPQNPRWMQDGSLIFHSSRGRSNGDLRSDIYRWWPKIDRLKRITHGASLSWADPVSNEDRVVCLYREYGMSALMILDLKTGETRELTEPCIVSVWQSPSVSPDGKSAIAVHRHDHYSDLVSISLKDGIQTLIYRGGDREVILAPVWSADGQNVFYSSDAGGIMNIHMLDIQTKNTSAVTRSISGVLFPEYSARDDSLYYIKPHAKGMDIHHLTSIKKFELLDLRNDYETVLPPANIEVPEPYKTVKLDPPEPYNPFKYLEYGFTGSGKHLPYQSSVEMGFWTGDPLGRFRLLALGGYGWDGGPSGASLILKYKKFPIHTCLKSFYIDQNPLEQKLTDEFVINGSEHKLTGLEITLDWKKFGGNTDLVCGVGGVFARYDPESSYSDSLDRFLGGLNVLTGAHGNYGELKFGTTAGIDGIVGSTEDNNWSLGIGSVAGFVGWKQTVIKCEWTAGKIWDDGSQLDDFILGNSRSSIESGWYNKNRVEIPWLPSGALTGTRYERFDLNLMMGLSSPLILYGSQINAWTGLKPDPQRVVGLEWRGGIPDLPLFRFGATEMTLGVAWGLDGLIEDDWRGYFCVRLIP